MGKATITSIALMLGLTVGMQSVTTQSADFDPPRLPNGNPNFNGIWQVLNAANYDIEPHIARSAMQLREGPHSMLPDVPVLALGAVGAVPGSMGVIKGGGRIPYTAEARALKEENQAHWVERDPEIKCYMPGVPRATYMPFPFQIFQNDSSVFIAYEFAGAVRDIYLQDVGPAETDSWMGQSVGHWEGDTLVVETTQFNPGQSFRGSLRHAVYISPDATVVERFTRKSEHEILYEFSVDDPSSYSSIWRAEVPMLATDSQIYEYACHEGNYSMLGILAGAREEERNSR